MYWIINHKTNFLFSFSFSQDAALFLREANLDSFRVLKDKGTFIVEIYLKGKTYEEYRKILENS